MGGMIPIRWGAASAAARGPVVTAPDPRRNAIGVPAAAYSIYRALGEAMGELSPRHRPNLAGTEPSAKVGPFARWSDPAAIVTFDPWGHRVGQDFAGQIAAGLDIRPSIAITDGRLRMAEIREAMDLGRLRADGRVLAPAGDIAVTKIAIEPVWALAGVAARLGLAEADLRRALHEATGGMYPDLVIRPDLPLFLPPIGGTSVYLFGDPGRLADPSTPLTCRVHDECNGSDVFGSDLCTCRPYLAFGVEEAVRMAQAGGLGVVAYYRKEGRALGEVVKLLVYNARRRAEAGDRPEAYFDRTVAVAGVPDLRRQELSVDVLHWLGVRRIDRWISMSNLKRDAVEAGGIEIVRQVVLPDALVPACAEVEIEAKKASGYYSGAA